MHQLPAHAWLPAWCRPQAWSWSRIPLSEVGPPQVQAHARITPRAQARACITSHSCCATAESSGSPAAMSMPPGVCCALGNGAPLLQPSLLSSALGRTSAAAAAGAFERKATLLCSQSITGGACGLWLNHPLGTLADSPSGTDVRPAGRRPRHQTGLSAPGSSPGAGSVGRRRRLGRRLLSGRRAQLQRYPGTQACQRQRMCVRWLTRPVRAHRIGHSSMQRTISRRGVPGVLLSCNLRRALECLMQCALRPRQPAGSAAQAASQWQAGHAHAWMWTESGSLPHAWLSRQQLVPSRLIAQALCEGCIRSGTRCAMGCQRLAQGQWSAVQARWTCPPRAGRGMRAPRQPRRRGTTRTGTSSCASTCRACARRWRVRRSALRCLGICSALRCRPLDSAGACRCAPRNAQVPAGSGRTDRKGHAGRRTDRDPDRSSVARRPGQRGGQRG